MDQSRLRSVMIGAARLTAVAMLITILAACKGSETLPSTDPGKAGLCPTSYSKTFEPFKIDGGHHLYFNSEVLEILSKKNFDLSAASLYVQLEEKKGGHDDDVITIGINGITATRPDGSKKFDKDDKKQVGSQLVKLEILKLNGGEPLELFLAKIYSQKGTLRLSLLGDLKVVSAYLAIEGDLYLPCTNPSPTPSPQPTPVPVAPQVSLLSVNPPEALTAQTSIAIEFAADQQGVNFLCSLDGAEPAVCSSPIAFASLAAGSHIFAVTGKNSAGLSGSASYQWTIDNVASAVTIDPVPVLLNVTSTAITFAASEAGAFECSLDASPFGACVSPFAAFAMNEGSHTFAVRFTDSLGNTSAVSQTSWVVDATPPLVQILAVTPAQGVSASLTREFQFAANESASFECSLDGAQFSVCASPVLYESLAEGNHVFEVRGTDPAGNVGVSATASWVTDITPPQVTLGSVLPAAGKSNAKEFTVEFTSNEPGLLHCSLDGADEVDCTSPFTSGFALDGEHTFRVVAEDVAGLRSSPVNVTWIIDRASPEIRFDSVTPSAAAYINVTSLTATVFAPEHVTMHATLNGEELADLTSPFELSGLGDGSYVLSVTGTDDFGNPTNTIEHHFTVDTVAPLLNASATTADGGLTNRNSNSFTLSANEEVNYQCELDGAGFSECVSPFDVSGLIDGLHEMRVFARDLAGNTSEIQTLAWTVDLTPPTSQITASQSARERYSFQFTASEPGSSFLCSVDGGLQFACTSPLTMSFAIGAHSFQVVAIDPAGNRQTFPSNFSVFVRDPITTAISSSPVSYTSSRSAGFTFTSNHVDAKFICSLDGAPMVSCNAPVNYSSLADGDHTFKVQAIDIFGYVDPVGASYTWTIDATAPVIVSTSTSTTSTSITVTWTTNELATGKLNWGLGFDSSRVTAESPMATSRTITLSGLSANTQYTIQLTGRDRAGNIYTGAKFQIKTRF